MVHILGVLGSISGPHCRVKKWSTSFCCIKIGVSEDFLNQVFRGVCRVFFFFLGVLVQKQASRKWQKLDFSFLFLCLLLHVTTRHKKGWQKRNYKVRVFGPPPFLREGQGRKEERGQRSKKHHHFSIKNVWALKRARSCSTFLGPKITVFKSV